MIVQQNTSEWLELRKGKIGASDACVIMGVSPWSTPYALWEEKVGIRENRVPTRSMQRGNALEKEARECFTKMTGILVMDMVKFHPKFDWMMASLDGIDMDGKEVVEIKCPGEEDHDMALHGYIPPKYYPQLQHQMEVAGIDKMHYFSYDGQEGALVSVPRNEKYIEDMIRKEKAFYQCMMTLEPPTLSDKDYVEKHDEEWFEVASSWVSCQENLNNWKEKEERLRNQLISMTEDKNCFGAGVKISRCVRKGTVDYNRIPELKDIDVNQYRKPDSQFWRISKS